MLCRVPLCVSRPLVCLLGKGVFLRSLDCLHSLNVCCFSLFFVAVCCLFGECVCACVCVSSLARLSRALSLYIYYPSFLYLPSSPPPSLSVVWLDFLMVWQMVVRSQTCLKRDVFRSETRTSQPHRCKSITLILGGPNAEIAPAAISKTF